MHLPKVEKTWSVGTILASATALITLVTVVGNIWWNTFTIAANARRVPNIEAKQEQDRSDIRILKSQQLQINNQYIDIKGELKDISNKLDSISRREAKNEGRLSRGS